MLIILGSDHGGFELKEKVKTWLTKQNYNIVDVGAFVKDDNDDFSKYVLLMRKCFDNNVDARVIAFCASGVGMNIGLNKHKGVRCVLAHDAQEVALARNHNDVNALAFGGKITTFVHAKHIIEAFLGEKSLKGKYVRRMSDIEIK